MKARFQWARGVSISSLAQGRPDLESEPADHGQEALPTRTFTKNPAYSWVTASVSTRQDQTKVWSDSTTSMTTPSGTWFFPRAYLPHVDRRSLTTRRRGLLRSRYGVENARVVRTRIRESSAALSPSDVSTASDRRFTTTTAAPTTPISLLCPGRVEDPTQKLTLTYVPYRLSTLRTTPRGSGLEL